ncbi:MAG: pilus assembly protein TadG-related protein [Deltaproteobacteria bacterium]|nr:pilus assembly protein TadG-related protein [Deltaproteobacteria bacterium]
MTTKILSNFIIKDRRGSVTVASAVMMVLLLTVAGLVIDLGRLYVIKVELQNAADAGALAGANALFNTDFQAKSSPIRRPYDPPIVPASFRPPLFSDAFPAFSLRGPVPWQYCATIEEPHEAVTYCDMARAAARATVMANRAGGEPLTLPDDDVQLGNYAMNQELGRWTFVPGTCSNETNAVRVITRKTMAVNGPVYLIFGQLLGRSYVELSAESVAMLGWVKGIGAGRGTFPLALGDKYMPEPGQSLEVTFNPNTTDTGGWHTFFDGSASAVDLKNLVNGTKPSPEIKCGDVINLTNGVDTSVIQEMFNEFYNRKNQDWTIILPVISSAENYVQQRQVIGFCAFTVTQVKGAPDKTVTGIAVGGYVLPHSKGGVPQTGLRASLPRLARS